MCVCPAEECALVRLCGFLSNYYQALSERQNGTLGGTIVHARSSPVAQETNVRHIRIRQN